MLGSNTRSPLLDRVIMDTMSVADIAARAIHLVLDRGRASVLQRQLREIDLLMLAGGGCTHLRRMWPRAHARRSIEYCEDVLAFLRMSSVKHEIPDLDLEAMCDVAAAMCYQFGGLDGGEPMDDEMRRDGMYTVTRMVDIIVQPNMLRPWAREHLDLRGIHAWYRHDHRASPADFHEIRDLLNARAGRGSGY